MAVWAALFLRSASPGAVFGFLERRSRAGEDLPRSLLLSDAAPPHAWRALIADRECLAAQGPGLSLAFGPRVTLVYQSETPMPVWAFLIWERGAFTEEGEEPLTATPRGLLYRLAGVKPAPSPAVVWARERGFPIERVPGTVARTKPVPVVEYRTVAGLDQRNLLVEDGPRLYRCDITDTPGRARGV